MVTLNPADIDAIVFDMDGVITDTARVHEAAWKRLFDQYLTTEAPSGADRRPFDGEDYRRYVDGRLRVDGVESFLASRGVRLERGEPTDPETAPSAWGLANRKNRYFHEVLATEGVDAFPSSIALARAARRSGVRTAVVTASRNRAAVLEAAGVSHLFDAHVDGIDIAELNLPGKPDPATFLEALCRLDIEPGRAVVIEDAVAGVEAGRAGGFGFVIGVDRSGQAERDLIAHGADVVVGDLDQVCITPWYEVPARDDPWHLDFEGFDPGQEGHREALCTVGNGVFGTRGAAPEHDAGRGHYPGTYAAGCFNRLLSELHGRRLEHESMVNLPNWLPLTFRPSGGRWLDLHEMAIERYRQRLDLRSGVLHRAVRVTDGEGRTTTIAERRLLSMAEPSIGALEWTIIPENWSGEIEIRSGIDGSVENRNVADERDLAGRHLEVIGGDDEGEVIWLEAATVQSHVRVAVAARTRVACDEEAIEAERQLVRGAGRIEHELRLPVTAGTAVTVEKVVGISTSFDHAISEPVSAARTAVGWAGGFDELLSAHAMAWRHLWARSRLQLEGGDGGAARALNLHVFHVLQTLSPRIVDRDVGVPARGLHGEAYHGHIFWDELLVVPLLTMRFPELSRELLLYRWRRLDAARRLAREEGRRGARYPWQSGSEGREETPTMLFNPLSQRWMPDNSRLQRHVGLAIAYNIWGYFQVTGDKDFLAAYGAEMLIEIARYFADLATFDDGDGRFHIRGVMGPDEFHDGYPDRPGSGVDDNAYTNVMVSWLLRRAIEVHELLSRNSAGELWERLHLRDDELARWDQVSRSLHVPFLHGGIPAQFEGYGELEELDWDRYRALYRNIGRLDLILEAEGDSPNCYQASKQADVLMLFYLFSAEQLDDLFRHLGYPFDPQAIPRTIDYYLERTSNGSTLSRVAHAWVLSRSDRERSWEVFLEALASDLDMQDGTTREGIHLGAMAGTIDLVQRCYTGLEIRDGVLRFNPRLPAELKSLSFPIHVRGHWLDVHVTPARLRIEARRSTAPALRIGVVDREATLAGGEILAVDLPGQ
ncbi:beta-phosphoglucomutase family hydrolase [Rhabdothermincola sp.]|uniref:beta-phosphoglucomutase family hydrolase n=1 Tax=Rhabdothermincola sp. TaxID=2820405 RepID=UPI002FE2B13F